MSRFPPLVVCLALACFSGCDDFAARLDGSSGVVEVNDTLPPEPVVPAPPLLAPPTVVPPTLSYAEAPPMPVQHTVRWRFEPATATTLDEVQSVELEVDVQGGGRVDRTVSLLFTSPNGVAWQGQRERLAGSNALQTLHFTLPVAATFVSDQRLTGDWQVTTFDDGLAQASATFRLEP